MLKFISQGIESINIDLQQETSKKKTSIANGDMRENILMPCRYDFFPHNIANVMTPVVSIQGETCCNEKFGLFVLGILLCGLAT